ncbi:hypothetical protein ANN_02059 [Periplaneta americana]|uniref:Uncharacterized protein n=1 Tax=Periplaneta americana TaxID=6978 RepID=A0ABQ8TZF3_PERAM|nr:hypothetical protein ANN_02059 [Periplaneta americana]
MAGLCEGGNEPPGSLKAIQDGMKANTRQSSENAFLEEKLHGGEPRTNREKVKVSHTRVERCARFLDFCTAAMTQKHPTCGTLCRPHHEGQQAED